MSDLKKARRLLWLFTRFRIPLMGYVRPELIKINEKEAVFRIKLRRRTRNHLNSMYFGALAVGADLAGGFHAFYLADKLNVKLSLAFKDFSAEFLKRPMGDVYFICTEGQKVKNMIDETLSTGERVTSPIQIMGVTDYPDNPEEIARFSLGLSLKNKTKTR
jgi:acyl-coenzyme A thioesterase PaaI-like protein